MAVEPYWLTLADVAAIHDDQLILHGGLYGFKDVGLVESATVAPQNLYHYDGVDDLLALAIRRCLALLKNHGFLDGNKRTATFAMIEFFWVQMAGICSCRTTTHSVLCWVSGSND